MNNLWLSDCGYPGDPRFRGLASLNSRVIGPQADQHVGFDIVGMAVSIES